MLVKKNAVSISKNAAMPTGDGERQGELLHKVKEVIHFPRLAVLLVEKNARSFSVEICYNGPA